MLTNRNLLRSTQAREWGRGLGGSPAPLSPTEAAPRRRTGRLVRAHLQQVQALHNMTPSEGEAAVGALRGSGLHSDMSSCLDQQLLSKPTCHAKVNNFLKKPNFSAGTGTILICVPACVCVQRDASSTDIYTSLSGSNYLILVHKHC